MGASTPGISEDTVKHLALFFSPASLKAFSLKLSHLVIKTASWDYPLFPLMENGPEGFAGKWFRLKLGMTASIAYFPWRPGMNPAAGDVVTDFTYSLVLCRAVLSDRTYCDHGNTLCLHRSV